jgi:hypothetical protein
MKTQIDKMNDQDTWTPSLGATITRTMQPWYIASGHDAALRVSFAAAGDSVTHLPNAPISLDFSTDQEATRYYDFFSLSLSGEYATIRTVDDFQLDIAFTGQDADGAASVTYHAYYQAGKLPQIIFYNPLTVLESVSITANKATEFVMSDLIAFTDEMPIDIYRGLAEVYESLLNPYQARLKVGTVTATPGASEVIIEDPRWIEQNTAIEFGGEKHLIEAIRREGTGAAINFSAYFDGPAVVGNHTDEPVYAYFPVLVEPGEDTAIAPSIALDEAMAREVDFNRPWGAATTHSFSGADDGRLSKQEISYMYRIALNPTSRHGKDMEYLAHAAGAGIKNAIWINGVLHNIMEQEDLSHQEGGDATEIMPGLTAPIMLTARERKQGVARKFGQIKYEAEVIR